MQKAPCDGGVGDLCGGYGVISTAETTNVFRILHFSFFG